MIYMFIAALSGAMIACQSSCNGLLYAALSVIGVSFASQFLNTVTSFIFSLVYFHRPPRLKGLPFHDCLGGLCSLIVLGFNGYLVASLGTAVTVCLSVSGQLIMSAVVDNFGWFGSEKIRFRAVRIPGFLCIFAGVFIINFAGGGSFGTVRRGLLLPLLIFAIAIGCITVFARLFNLEASYYVGKLDGNFANSGFGAAVAFVILMITSRFRFPLKDFMSAPPLGYLSGPIGTVSCVLNSLSYIKLKAFHATLFLLIGQIVAGIVIDLITLGIFSAGKIIGIAVICAGIFLDKKITADAA